MKTLTLKLLGKRQVLIVSMWVVSLVLSIMTIAFLERQQHFSELQKEASILHRQASQRADQHDAHLTSLIALVLAGRAERHDLFLEVVSTIQRLYPRIEAIDLISLDNPARYLSSRQNLTNHIIETVIAGAKASKDKLTLTAIQENKDHYLVVQRTPKTDSTHFGLALTVNVDKLLSSDRDFWKQHGVTRRLRLPDGGKLFDLDLKTDMQFRKPLGSKSQPLIFEAGITPRLADLLPISKVLTVLVAVTVFYILTILGLRQFVRARFAEQQARISADEARLAHTARVNDLGEMASGIAHEITQPLTAILAQAQAGRHLVRREDVVGSEASFTRIIDQAKRAAAILGRLRDWTSPQSQNTDYTAINEGLTNVEALLRRDAKIRDITLTFDLSLTNGLLLRHDRIFLEQIVFNLARNAMEAVETSTAASVNIKSNVTETEITVDVSDSGSGVPSEIRERVFEPFVTNKPNGTGLGLALCQRLAERMGGKLSLLEDTKLTVFRLSLPKSLLKKYEAV